MIGSCICKYSDFEAPWYRAAERVLRIRELYRGHSSQRHDFANRKFWEWCAIATALQERWITRPKALGIGFAVGTEPLASHFAACGCDVLGTDLDAAAADPAWVNTAQHARSLEQMHKPQLVSADEFVRHVSFAPMDMRAIRGAEQSRDFVWSSCALEHLGSLEAGIEFLLKSSQLLRAGGVAAHTTEINLSSNDERSPPVLTSSTVDATSRSWRGGSAKQASNWQPWIGTAGRIPWISTPTSRLISKARIRT